MLCARGDFWQKRPENGQKERNFGKKIGKNSQICRKFGKIPT